MTMRLALSSADVRTPDGRTIESAVVMSRNGRLTVSERRGAVLVETAITAITPTGRREWDVTADEGTYVVTKPKGCGCGG